MIHRVELNNGQVLLIEEGDNCLHLADLEDPKDKNFPTSVGSYICQITPSGVLVMPNSGGATLDLTENLRARRLYALCTDSGTADADTCLCEDHFDQANRSIASRNALAKGDIRNVEHFKDCTQNDALRCIFCGHPSDVPPMALVRSGLKEASRALTELDPEGLKAQSDRDRRRDPGGKVMGNPSSDQINPWQPMSRPIDLKHIGKLLEELGEATASCVEYAKVDHPEVAYAKVKMEDELADVSANTRLCAEHFDLQLTVEKWSEELRLDTLTAQLGRTVAAASRCLIQGLDGTEPTTGKGNKDWLQQELSVLIAYTDSVIRHYRLDIGRMAERAKRKRENLTRWHQALD